MTATTHAAPGPVRAARGPSLLGVVRSELLRLRRPGLLLGWLGLTAVFAALINTVMFQVAGEDGGPPQDGPGVRFPSLAELLGADGLVAGLGAASSLFGVLTLAFWGLAGATDHSSGLIRLLVAAEPRRWRLLAGKWIALALVTAGATAVAVVVNLGVAPAVARAGGYATDAWSVDPGPVVAAAALNLFLALLVWGTLGLVLAVLTRSAGIAIGVGVGWVLLLESVLTAAVSALGDWLPGATIGALAAGGTDAIPYGTALGLGLGYVAVALGAALVVVRRRDVTD